MRYFLHAQALTATEKELKKAQMQIDKCDGMEDQLDTHAKKLNKEVLTSLCKTRVVWAELDSCVRLGSQTSGESLTVPFVKQIEEKLALAVSELIDKGVLLTHHLRSSGKAKA